MRTQLIECKTRKTAVKRCPWAAIIVKVVGGYLCFESVADCAVWKRQK